MEQSAATQRNYPLHPSDDHQTETESVAHTSYRMATEEDSARGHAKGGGPGHGDLVGGNGSKGHFKPSLSLSWHE